MIFTLWWVIWGALGFGVAQAVDCDVTRGLQQLERARISSVAKDRIVFNEGKRTARIPESAHALIRDFIGYTVTAEICADQLGELHLENFEIDFSRRGYHVQILEGVVTAMRIVGENEYTMGLYRPGTLLVLIERPDGEPIEVAMGRRTYTGSADPDVPNVEGLEVALGDYVRFVTHTVRSPRLVSSDRAFLLKSYSQENLDFLTTYDMFTKNK